MTQTLLAVAVSVTVIASCGGPDPVSPSQQPIPVHVQQVVSTELPQTRAYSGNLEGIRRVNLSTKIMGPIYEMNVAEGSRVAAGQVLARIKSDDLSAKRAQVRANLIEARAAWKNMETQYERIRALYAHQTATQKEMDDMEMNYQMAKAKVQAIEEMEKEVSDVIGFGDVVSPIHGSIVKRWLQPGDMAVPGMPILTVEDVDRMQAVIQVPETDVSLFRKGTAVLVRVDAVPAVALAATVDEINPGGNPMSRQFDVKVHLQDRHESLRSGMFAQVLVTDQTSPNVVIHRTALVHRGQLDGVFVVNDRQEALLRWIRIGKTVGDQVEVLAGVTAGENVVVGSRGRLLDGGKVEVLP